MEEILIISTSVFSLSAVDHIHKILPELKLSVVSRPSSLAPSADSSKIARIDYTSTLRMREAMKAYSEWQNNELFIPNQRRIGRVMVYDRSDVMHTDINRARRDLNLLTRVAHGPELMEKYFGTTSASKELVYSYNEDDLIIDWATCILQALERARAACQKTGGSIYETGVRSLVHDCSRITEVVLDDGRRIDTAAAQIVLAPGPWFVDILAASSITPPPPHRSPTPTGLFSYNVQLSDDQVKLFQDKPMLSHEGVVDFLPPANIGGTICKITWIEPFTESRGSYQPQVRDLSNSALAKRHMLKVVEWVRNSLPALSTARIISVTSYWDGVTSTQEPVISQHPEIQNLICAAGGSFNRAKDLPTIGEMVGKAALGNPVPAQYSWDSKNTSCHHDQPRLVSRGEFVDMEIQAGKEIWEIMGNEAGADILDLIAKQSAFTVI